MTRRVLSLLVLALAVTVFTVTPEDAAASSLCFGSGCTPPGTCVHGGTPPNPNIVATALDVNGSAGHQAEVGLSGITGCNLTIARVDAVLAGTTATLQALQVDEGPSGDGCGIGTRNTLLITDLGLTSSISADRWTLEPASGSSIVANSAGDNLCVEFLGADSSDYEKVNVYYFYQ